MQYQLLDSSDESEAAVPVPPIEAADRLGLDVGSIYYLIKTQKIRNYGTPTRFEVLLSDVEAYLPVLRSRKRDQTALREISPQIAVGDLLVWLRWGLVSEYEGKGIVFLHDDSPNGFSYFRKDVLDDLVHRGDVHIVKPLTLLRVLADYVAEFHDPAIGAGLALLAAKLTTTD